MKQSTNALLRYLAQPRDLRNHDIPDNSHHGTRTATDQKSSTQANTESEPIPRQAPLTPSHLAPRQEHTTNRTDRTHSLLHNPIHTYTTANVDSSPLPPHQTTANTELNSAPTKIASTDHAGQPAQHSRYPTTPLKRFAHTATPPEAHSRPVPTRPTFIQWCQNHDTMTLKLQCTATSRKAALLHALTCNKDDTTHSNATTHRNTDSKTTTRHRKRYHYCLPVLETTHLCGTQRTQHLRTPISHYQQ